MEKDFENLYQEIMANNQTKLKDLEAKVKKENRTANSIFTTIIIVLDVLLLYGLSKMTGTFILKMFKFQGLMMLFVSNILAFALFVAIKTGFSKNIKEYNRIFKENVIDDLLRNFYEELDYIPKRQMERSIYDEGKYNEFYNKYYSDDYLEGKIDNKYQIKMAEVRTEEETTYKDSDGNMHTENYIRFHGLFAEIKMDKSIKNELTIKPNGGVFGKTRLEMDSQEFEKLFDVSSNDKIIGMQLLTHDVMEELVEFKNNCKYRFDVCVYYDTIYLRLATGSAFEIKSIKKGALNKEVLRGYYNILERVNNLARKIINTVENTEI